MQKIIFYVSVFLCLFLSKTYGQSFEQQAKIIANSIDKITKTQKDSLKTEIESLESALKNSEISKEEFESKKIERAEFRADKIERLVGIEEEKLSQLVKDKVEGKVMGSVSSSDTIFIGNKKRLQVIWNNNAENDTLKRVYKEYSERRTTSQFVLAFGLNNALTDGDLSTLEDSEYRAWRSRFFEWGVTWKTRILPNSNLLQAKYGLSLMYNNLRPEGGQYFVKDEKQTILVSDSEVEKSRFRNVYLAIPMHLEFDFSKNKLSKEGKSLFRSQKSFRLGIGGYAGVRIKSVQCLWGDSKIRERGDFNASDFLYGMSGYIGYGSTSLYVKYDLNPIFKDNPVEQNNISLGIRFDFN